MNIHEVMVQCMTITQFDSGTKEALMEGSLSMYEAACIEQNEEPLTNEEWREFVEALNINGLPVFSEAKKEHFLYLALSTYIRGEDKETIMKAIKGMYHLTVNKIK